MASAPLPELVGNRALAISLGAGKCLPARADRMLRDFVVARDGSGVLASERSDCIAVAGEAAAALGTRHVLAPEFAHMLDAAALVRALPRAPALFAPAVAIARQGGRIQAWADRYGIGQLFLYRGDGIAAVATSATMLARLFGAPLASPALIGFALTGNFLGSATGFKGIEKVAAGTRVVITDGAARCEDAASPLAYRGEPESTLEEVTEAFVAAVRRMHAAFPDAELELSGGLDSRLILAALPPEARRGKRAMTIGPADSGDARIAAQLAEREGLAHRLVASDGFMALDADGLEALIARIVLGYDHLANPLDKLAIVSAGLAAGEEPEARFGGQNGEILRGFYYAAQPIERPPSEELARRLLAWRLEANDRVSDELIDAGALAQSAPRVRSDILATLLQRGEDHWWQALDRLYLTQRMPRWVGASSTNRFIARTSLYPFFDPDFVSAAMRLPGTDKRNSRAAYRMLSRIDSTLAALPLDNGITPGRAHKESFDYLASKVNFIIKILKKANTKLRGNSKPVLGSSSAIDLWYGLSLSKRLPVKSLNGTGLVDRSAVESIARTGRRFDRASLGWLLLVEGLIGSDEWNTGDGQVSH